MAPRLQKLLILLLVIDTLAIGYLLHLTNNQSHRIQTLERHDKVTQAINSAKSKTETLKNRVEGLFK